MVPSQYESITQTNKRAIDMQDPNVSNSRYNVTGLIHPCQKLNSEHQHHCIIIFKSKPKAIKLHSLSVTTYQEVIKDYSKWVAKSASQIIWQLNWNDHLQIKRSGLALQH